VLITIAILTSLLFASIYPLCFWISFDNPLKNNFHKFHLGLPNFVGGLTVIGLLLMPTLSLTVKILAVAWKVFFLSTSRYFWKRGNVHPLWITLTACVGLIVYGLVRRELTPLGIETIFMDILGGGVLCAAIYAMNLGHWYLNIHGLSLHHLTRAVYVFWDLVALRLLGDSILLATTKIIHFGDSIPLYIFAQRLDGILLWVAVSFGTILPAILLWYVRATLLVKSTQSATGILYVILIAVFMGDLVYKYYLVKYGIVL